MTDTTRPSDGTWPTQDVPPAVAARRAVVLVLERAGPLPPWRVVTVLAGADIEITPDDLDRLVADGVITRVRGRGDTELVALPHRAAATDWRSAVAGLPPPVLAGATVALLLVLVLVLMAVNGADASWPAIDWGPPPS